MNLLKNHPFAVETHFDSSLVLTYAFPREQLRSLIPDRLELDTFNDEWAFVAVAMVAAKGLRPKGFPRFLGNDFFLIGFRIFVRYTDKRGKRLRGLFILKSETNKKKMKVLGNVFTHYNYTTTDIEQAVEDHQKVIRSVRSDFEVIIDSKEEHSLLPPGSPFSSWKGARRFAGPLPFTFTCQNGGNQVLIIKGVRQNWQPTPVSVKHHRFGFLKKHNLDNGILANAFEIRDVPYYWEKGKLETWS